MASEGRRVAECAGRGARPHGDALRHLTRAGNLDPQRSGGLSGRRTVPARQRHPQRAVRHLGWTRPGAGRTLHGGAGRYAAEPRDSSVLSALVPSGQGEEARVDGLHAEVAHDLE